MKKQYLQSSSDFLFVRSTPCSSRVRPVLWRADGGTEHRSSFLNYALLFCWEGLWGSSGLPVLELPRSDGQKLC